MRKYFMQGTTNEVENGDVVVWDNIDEMEDGHNLHQHLECVFNEHTLPILLDKNIIEESEDEEEDTPNEEEETLDFMDECPVIENFNALEGKVNAMETTLTEIAKVVADLADSLSDLTKVVVKQQKPKKNGGK